jgi:phosphoribosyl-ATP pyrophosphohydrolase
MLGKNHTPEAIEKIREAGTGRKHSDKARAKISRARKGKKPSAATIAASVAARIGKKLTEEHRQKIAATTQNRKAVLVVETGQTFDSVTAASKALMVSEASVNQAIRKGCRCRGNHLQFL